MRREVVVYVTIILTWTPASRTIVVAPETGQDIQIQAANQPGLVGYTQPRG